MKDNRKLAMRISFAFALVLIVSMMIGIAVNAAIESGKELDARLLGASTLDGKTIKATVVLANKANGGTIAKTDKFVVSSVAPADGGNAPGASITRDNTLATSKNVVTTKGGSVYYSLLTFSRDYTVSSEKPLYVYNVNDKKQDKQYAVAVITNAEDLQPRDLELSVTQATGKVKQELNVLGLSGNDQVVAGDKSKVKAKKTVDPENDTVTLVNKDAKWTEGKVITINQQPFYGEFDSKGCILDAPMPACAFTRILGDIPAVVTDPGDVQGAIVDNAKAKSDLVVLYGLTPGSNTGIFNYPKGDPNVGAKDDFIKGGSVKAGRTHIVFDGVTLKYYGQVYVGLTTGDAPAKVGKGYDGVRAEKSNVLD